MNETNPSPRSATILYDGSCPLCRSEIDMIRRATRDPEMRFADVSKDGTALPAGLTSERAMARFHAIDADGNVLSGARAFALVWSTVPAMRPLAWLIRVPFLTPLFDAAYSVFLKVRPTLQRLARSRPRAVRET